MIKMTILVTKEMIAMPIKSDTEKQMQKKYLLEIGKVLLLQYGIKKLLLTILWMKQTSPKEHFIYISNLRRIFLSANCRNQPTVILFSEKNGLWKYG